MRPVPQSCIDFLKGAEGLWLTGKRDLAGVATWGYGHTGSDVVVGGAITLSQAESLLFADATHAAIRLAGVVKDAAIQGLTEHQYAALVSFVFNLGAHPSDPIWALLNSGKLDAATIHMMKYDKAEINGTLVVVPGLFNRRAAEVSLFKTADVGAAITIAQTAQPPPSGETAALRTPPTPMSQKPAWSSKTFGTATIATLATGAAYAQNALTGAKAAIAPYVADSTVLTAINEHMALVAAGLSVATMAFAYLKSRSTS